MQLFAEFALITDLQCPRHGGLRGFFFLWCEQTGYKWGAVTIYTDWLVGDHNGTTRMSCSIRGMDRQV
jgi:hypothetical protein